MCKEKRPVSAKSPTVGNYTNLDGAKEQIILAQGLTLAYQLGFFFSGVGEGGIKHQTFSFYVK